MINQRAKKSLRLVNVREHKLKRTASRSASTPWRMRTNSCVRVDGSAIWRMVMGGRGRGGGNFVNIFFARANRCLVNYSDRTHEREAHEQ